MAITVISRPSTSWNALGNDAIYRFERRDRVYGSWQDNGGNGRFIFTASGNLTAFFPNGATIYVYSNDSNGPRGLFQVVSTSYAEPNFSVTINFPFASLSDNNGYVNNNLERRNYALEVELFNGVTDAKIVDAAFKYTPDTKGAITVDVSKIILGVLTGQTSFNQSPQLSVTSITSEVLASWVSYYVKYREVWTGSAESQTNDSANIRRGISASRQILQESSVMSLYSTTDSGKQFLTKVKKRKVKADQTPFTTIVNEATSTLYFVVGFDGNKIYTPVDNITVPSVALFGLFARKVDSIGRIGYKFSFKDWQLGSGTDWTITGVSSQASVDLAADATSKRLALPIVVGGTIRIRYNFIVNNYRGNSTSNQFRVYLTDLNNANQTLGVVEINANGTYEGVLQFNTSTALLNSRILSVEFKAGSGTGSGDQENELQILAIERASDTLTLYQASVPSATPIAETVKSETLNIEVEELCNNDLTLMWRNSLGGLEQHTFPYNQEMEYINDQGRRFKEMLLFDQDLTLDKWEALNELMSPKEPVKENIVELTTSTFRSDYIDNQQVYLMSPNFPSDFKAGVIVIPQTNTTRTKRSKHDIGIRIRLPEYYL